jgi:hypothetical protein
MITWSQRLDELPVAFRAVFSTPSAGQYRATILYPVRFRAVIGGVPANYLSPG